MAITGNPGDLATGGFGTGISGRAATPRDVVSAVSRGETMAREREGGGGNRSQVTPAANATRSVAPDVGTGYRGPMSTWGSSSSVVPGSLLGNALSVNPASVRAQLGSALNRFNQNPQMGLASALGMVAPYRGMYGFAREPFALEGLFGAKPPSAYESYTATNPGATQIGTTDITLGELRKAVKDGTITDPELARQVTESEYDDNTRVKVGAFANDLSAFNPAGILGAALSSAGAPAAGAGSGRISYGEQAAPASTPATQGQGYVPSESNMFKNGVEVFKSATPSAAPAMPDIFRQLPADYVPSDYVNVPGGQTLLSKQQNAFTTFVPRVDDLSAFRTTPTIPANVQEVFKSPSQSRQFAPSGEMYTMDNVPVGVSGTDVPPTQGAPAIDNGFLGPVNIVPENYYTNSENVPDYQPGLLEVLGQEPVNDLSPRADWQVIESQPTPYSPAPEDAGVFEKFANVFKPGNLFPYAKDVNPIEGTPEGQYIQQTEFGPLKGFISVPYRYEPMDKPVYGAPGVPDGWTAPVKGASVITFKDGGGIWKHPSQGWQPISQFRGDLGDMYKGEGGNRAQKEAVAAAKLNADETATTSSTEGTDSSMLPQWYLDWLQSTGQYGGLLG